MSPSEYAHRVLRFGDFALDLDRGSLYRGEVEIHLRPKAFAVLRLLLENRSQLVTKTQLHDAVWKGSCVTDDSLAHCIADIRRALGENGFELIRTVPRRGYVFDHSVIHELASSLEPYAARKSRRYRLGAVAAGLAGTVLLGFGASQDLVGPVEPSIDTDERHSATLAASARMTTDMAAHNNYEKARFFYNRRADGDLALAEDHFKAALQHDPSFAGAWIGLAGIYTIRFSRGEMSREDALPLLGDATRHAVTLAPGSAKAHIRRATYYRISGKPSLAQRHLETAVVLEPDDTLVLGRIAGQLADRGRLDEAVEIQYRAVQTDPTSALQYHNLVWYLLAAGRTAAAAIEAQHYRALKPQAIGEADSLFADVMILNGNYEQALIIALNMAGGPIRDRNLAIIHYALGQFELADEALERLLASEYEVSEFHIAEVFARRGQLDDAAEWLTASLESPARAAATSRQPTQDSLLLLSPYLLGLRGDRRWKALYAKVQDARGASLLLASAGFEQQAKTQ